MFDSVGTSEAFLNEILGKKIEGQCVFNRSRVQGQESDKCGEFCAYFILNRFANLDLDLSDLLNDIFEEDPKENEKNVVKFLNEFKSKSA